MKKKYPFVIILGIAQDGGYPHAGCLKSCCKPAWKNPLLKKHVSCMAVVDPVSDEAWMIDATPDFPHQLYMLNKISPGMKLKGILLTHGHTGHYSGLIYLGKEAMNTEQMPVYAAPKMAQFLSENKPWKQLVINKNIKMRLLRNFRSFKLNKKITITPFKVHHRDEFTETLGYRVAGSNSSVEYIPDIDSWDNMLIDIIGRAGRAYIDGTFYDNNEIPQRNITKIPHPFISETMLLLNELPKKEIGKVHFLHLNHSNPALIQNSPQWEKINSAGFHIAKEFDKFFI